VAEDGFVTQPSKKSIQKKVLSLQINPPSADFPRAGGFRGGVKNSPVFFDRCIQLGNFY
jgi:hypothetical protein